MSARGVTGHRARRGVALPLVLWVLVLLGGVTTAVVAAAREGMDVAGNARARAQGRYAAESGVVAALDALEAGLRAAGDDSLARRAVLNAPDRALGEAAAFDLGEARVAVTVVDVSARLDVNAATEEQLTRLLARFGTPGAAARTAAAIRAHVDGDGDGARPLRSLDALRAIADVDPHVVDEAAPYLTVDGDGTVNRATAPEPVRAVAAGSLQDEPSRLLVVARGWRRGTPLTYEVQAVFAVQGAQLAFVRRRERER